MVLGHDPCFHRLCLAGHAPGYVLLLFLLGPAWVLLLVLLVRAQASAEALVLAFAYVRRLVYEHSPGAVH